MKKLFALTALLLTVSVCFGYNDVDYVKAWMKLFVPIVIPTVLFICGTIVAIFVTKVVVRSRTRIKEAKYEMLKKFAENGHPMPIEVIREMQSEIPYEMYQGQQFQNVPPQNGQSQSGQGQNGQSQFGQTQNGQPQYGGPMYSHMPQSSSHARPLKALGIAMFVLGVLFMINSHSWFVACVGLMFSMFAVFMLLQIYGYLPWMQRGCYSECNNYNQYNRPPYGQPFQNGQPTGFQYNQQPTAQQGAQQNEPQAEHTNQNNSDNNSCQQ